MEKMKTSIDFEIKYTLAFCIVSGQVLMLLRKRPPNVNLWNGLGGKIEGDETPAENVRRELLEEAGIDVIVSDHHYKGIVKWNILDQNKIGGTHLFIFELEDLPYQEAAIDTDEGLLAWKSRDWVTDTANTELVENIPIFMSQALLASEPQIYEFIYEASNKLISHNTHKLF
jgi:8-oxo-dGTP diphosphatase